jgi:hypothetical protein
MISLLPNSILLRVRDEAETVLLEPSGTVAMAGTTQDLDMVEFVNGQPVRVVPYESGVSVSNIPDAGDILVTSSVARAMCKLGIKHPGRVYTPGLVEDGVTERLVRRFECEDPTLQ